MQKQSAGLLIYKIQHNKLFFLLVHPGGPFWKNKDEGIWSIPKGEYTNEEDPLTVAKRELEEETGNVIKAKKFLPLKSVITKAGKHIVAWAAEENFSQPFIHSNYVDIAWPPKTSKILRIPEVDKAEYFEIDNAKKKILQSQLPFILELEEILKKQTGA